LITAGIALFSLNNYVIKRNQTSSRQDCAGAGIGRIAERKFMYICRQNKQIKTVAVY
jgi:hypothetical protein